MGRHTKFYKTAQRPRLADGGLGCCAGPRRAAVFYEMQRYEDCIRDCDEAVERGRELRADYKMIGRALTRKGNAMAKLGDLEGAIRIYDKALTEHRWGRRLAG